jgi:hypothetical protein
MRNSKMKRSAVFTACLLLLVAASSAAVEVSTQEGPVKLTVDGQVRIRGESYGDSRPDGDSDREFSMISQRTRLGVRADIEDEVKVYFQLQDARVWGEEADTLADYNADNFDLHQGWAEFRIPDGPAIRSGRQEIFWDNHRLVGNVGWTNQARSFDGFRLRYRYDDFALDSIYTVIEEPDSMNGTTMEADFYGANLKWTPLPRMSLSGVYLVQMDGDRDLERHTYGAYFKFRPSGFSTHAEYYQQAGEIGINTGEVLEIKAYMYSAGFGFDVDGVYGFYVYGDRLSGDERPMTNDYRAFDTLYATNHRFYGYMDNLLNIPAQTAGRGLIDYAARVYGGIDEVKLTADYHRFELSEDDANGEVELGDELDLILDGKVSRGFSLKAGYSVFWPGEVMAGPGRKASEHWTYVMVSFSF